MKKSTFQHPVSDVRTVPSHGASSRGRGRRSGRLTGDGRRPENHRTPLEAADAYLARLDEDLDEEEVETMSGPELLDPAFDVTEDLGSFVKLSTVTTALCGTWSSWVADDAE